MMNITNEVNFMKKLLLMSLLVGLIANTCFLSALNEQDNDIKTHGAKRMFNARDNEGNTPAHIMAIDCQNEYYNDPENVAGMFAALAGGSFNPFIENNNHQTPRDEATSRGCVYMAQLFVEYEKAYRLYYQDQIKGQ
jgi:ankyrin repeat protein